MDATQTRQLQGDRELERVDADNDMYGNLQIDESEFPQELKPQPAVPVIPARRIGASKRKPSQDEVYYRPHNNHHPMISDASDSDEMSRNIYDKNRKRKRRSRDRDDTLSTLLDLLVKRKHKRDSDDSLGESNMSEDDGSQSLAEQPKEKLLQKIALLEIELQRSRDKIRKLQRLNLHLQEGLPSIIKATLQDCKRDIVNSNHHQPRNYVHKTNGDIHPPSRPSSSSSPGSSSFQSRQVPIQPQHNVSTSPLHHLPHEMPLFSSHGTQHTFPYNPFSFQNGVVPKLPENMTPAHVSEAQRSLPLAVAMASTAAALAGQARLPYNPGLPPLITAAHLQASQAQRSTLSPPINHNNNNITNNINNNHHSPNTERKISIESDLSLPNGTPEFRQRKIDPEAELRKFCPDEKVEEINSSATYTRMTSGLMLALFDKEELARSSITGRRGVHQEYAKPALNAKKVCLIIDYVLQKFPTVTSTMVKAKMAQKCRDVNIAMKRGHQQQDFWMWPRVAELAERQQQAMEEWQAMHSQRSLEGSLDHEGEEMEDRDSVDGGSPVDMSVKSEIGGIPCKAEA